MLYLGQVCKFEHDGKMKPGIVLGIKYFPITKMKAVLLLFKDEFGIPSQDTFDLKTVGFITITDAKSPTGKRIYKGEFDKGIVNEHIQLKPPANAEEILNKAEELMKI